jgi:hypothetical protein
MFEPMGELMSAPACIAIDWSGAKTGAHRKIVLGEADGASLVRLEDGRDRDQIADHLIALAEQNPHLVIGLDFAFSLPAWFLDDLGVATGPDLWELACERAEDWLAACQLPFWGRPGIRRPELPAHHRWTETEAPATGAIRPKSVFQIGGSGAVGTGSLRGMRLLHRLHAAGFSIWPFDPPGWPRVVEIYPRLLTGPVKKRSATECAVYLDNHYPTLPAELRAFAASSEDAFDAAVSALVMAQHAEDLASLPTLTDPLLVREGMIWHPGWRAINR